LRAYPPPWVQSREGEDATETMASRPLRFEGEDRQTVMAVRTQLAQLH